VTRLRRHWLPGAKVGWLKLQKLVVKFICDLSLVDGGFDWACSVM